MSGTVALCFLAALVVFLLCKAAQAQFRFERLCRLVAIEEDALLELSSTEGLDGNDANPYERKLFSKIVNASASFGEYGNPEIERLALQIKRDYVVIISVFSALAISLLCLLFLMYLAGLRKS